MSKIERVFKNQRYRNNKEVWHWCRDGDCHSPSKWARLIGITAEAFFYRWKTHGLVDEIFEPTDGRHAWHRFRASDGTEAVVRCVCRHLGIDVDPRVFRHEWNITKGARAVRRSPKAIRMQMASYQSEDDETAFWLAMCYYLARGKGWMPRGAKELVDECRPSTGGRDDAA